MSEKSCVFVNYFLTIFGGVHAPVFTKPAVTRDLFDLQTSLGACWKDNELQNTWASSEFQMSLQVRLETTSASFRTTLVFQFLSIFFLNLGILSKDWELEQIVTPGCLRFQFWEQNGTGTVTKRCLPTPALNSRSLPFPA